MTTEEAYKRVLELEERVAKWGEADSAEALHKALGCMYHSMQISKLPDCNTCAKKLFNCKHLPRYGDYARINCPLYVANPEVT